MVAFIDVGVSLQRGVGFDEVAARLYRYPEVISAHLVSGGGHLRVIVEVESIRQVAAFVTEKPTPIEYITATGTKFSSTRTRRTDRCWWRTRPTTAHPQDLSGELDPDGIFGGWNDRDIDWCRASFHNS